MASPEESNRSRKKLDCGNSLKWLSLWDLSCSDIAGCSRGLDVFGSRSCLLENNSWNWRGGWTTGRKKVLNILIANFAGEHNAVELSRPHKFKSWHFQTAGHQSRLRKQVSLCVLPVKRENGALHGWTGWKEMEKRTVKCSWQCLEKGKENWHVLINCLRTEDAFVFLPRNVKWSRVVFSPARIIFKNAENPIHIPTCPFAECFQSQFVAKNTLEQSISGMHPKKLIKQPKRRDFFRLM